MDFDVQPVASVAEFLAVLIAGFGNNLAPLTGDDGEDPCPKALLPIANRPMIDYPLSWIDQSGIKDVLLICPHAHRSAISNHIDNDSTSSFGSLRIDVQGVEDVSELEQGTSAVLLQFANRIKTDFILLPCDFIPPPSLPLTQILNVFRARMGAEEGVVTACWFEAPNDKSSFEDNDGSTGPVPIIWNGASSSLLYIRSNHDVDGGSDEITLRASLLSRHPRLRMSSKFQDSHVYICRRSLLNVLDQKPRLESLRDDFFPWLCKLQYQATRRDKYGRVLIPLLNTGSQAASLQHSTMHTGPKSGPATTLSGTTSPEEDAEDAAVSYENLCIGLVLHRLADGCATRVNTLNAFLDANRRALSSPDYTYMPPSEPDRRSLVDVKAQVSADSMVGESTKVGERTTIKKSVIGKHCTIGKMVKIVGCVILDHCVIEDGAKLESCLISRNSKIGAKADLNRCATQAGYEVDAGETAKNEKMETSNWAATEQQDEDSDSDASHQDEDEDE